MDRKLAEKCNFTSVSLSFSEFCRVARQRRVSASSVSPNLHFCNVLCKDKTTSWLPIHTLTRCTVHRENERKLSSIRARNIKYAFASHKVVYHCDVPGAVWWESRKVLQLSSAIRNNRATNQPTNLRQQITQGWSHVCSAVINCKTLLSSTTSSSLPRFLVDLCSKILKSICSNVFIVACARGIRLTPVYVNAISSVKTPARVN